MKPGIADRRERWRFTAAIGTCTLFMKGLNGIWGNKYATREIITQAECALEEVQKLAFLIKDRFKGTP